MQDFIKEAENILKCVDGGNIKTSAKISIIIKILESFYGHGKEVENEHCRKILRKYYKDIDTGKSLKHEFARHVLLRAGNEIKESQNKGHGD